MKYVIHNMILSSIKIYVYLVISLKSIESWIRNFLWNDDVYKRELIIIAWHKCCRLLGPRSLISLNKAFNMKLSWDFLNVIISWSIYQKARVLSNGIPFKHHILLSVWNGMKVQFITVQ